jgi:hypothetical protein
MFYLPVGISPGLTVVGIGVMVYAFVLLSRRTAAVPRNGVMVSSESHRVINNDEPPPASNPKPLSDLPVTAGVLAPTVILPDGRAISNCSLEDLEALYKANTIDQANRLLTGKWIKLSGKVFNNFGKGKVFLVSDPIITLHFAEGWEDQLSTLKRGSEVTLRGQIVEVDHNSINLRGCELV